MKSGAGFGEEEQVVHDIARGEGRVGGAIIAAAVAGEIDVDGAPLVLGEVFEDDVTIVLDGGVENLGGDFGAAGEVITKAKFAAGTDLPDGIDLDANEAAVFFAVVAGSGPIGAAGRVVNEGEFAGPIFFFFAGVERGEENDALGERLGFGRFADVKGEENDVIDEQLMGGGLIRFTGEHFEIVHAFARDKTVSTAVVTLGMGGEIDGEFAPLIGAEAGEVNVPIVFGSETEMLDDGRGASGEVVTKKKPVFVADARAGDRVDTGHDGAEILVWAGRRLEGGAIAGINRELIGLGRAKPRVIRGLRFEVASGPDTMGKGFWFGAGLREG